MRFRRTVAASLAALALATSMAGAASAAEPPSNVAELLAADGVAFDRNWRDYDIVEAAALTVITNKPGTPVALLADDSAALTVLAPNDRAFQLLAFSLTGKWSWTEAAVVNSIVGAISSLGLDPIDTLETVLLYHVIPGRLTSADVIARSGQPVTTAQGGTIGIRAYGRLGVVRLIDQDRNALDPFLVRSQLNIGAGNSIVHGINLVLRPVDLPRGF
jgi:uncharacterized surface protein with fasciclin (FAS1) repeats